MVSWKVVIIQSFIIVILCYMTIQYSALTQLTEIQLQQEILSNESSSLETRIARIEKEINALIQAEPLKNTPLDSTHANEEYNEKVILSQRLHALEEKQSALGEAVTSLIDKQGNYAQPQKRSIPARPHEWLSALTEEKQSMVKEIYQDQIVLMQEKTPVSLGNSPPDPKEMQSFLQENREELKIRLMEILNEDEYQSFLNSMPPLPLIPSPPTL